MVDLFEGNGSELVGGKLVAMAPAGVAHQRAAYKIQSILDQGVGDAGSKEWEFLSDVFVVFAPGVHIYAPDISAWRVERFRAPDIGEMMTVTPDWVCEIRSPSDSDETIDARRAVFGQCGVRHHWLADPVNALIVGYEWRSERWVEIGRGSGKSGSLSLPPFEGEELSLAEIFKFA